MSAATIEAPRVLHTLPGRLRLHLGRWASGEEQAIEANPRTGNLLI